MSEMAGMYYQHWILFIWGACWGSFMNVVIYRYPLGKSVIHPPSACPSCNQPIAAYDNIPICSWLILGGKCRKCKAPFSPRYALIEAGYGLIMLGAWFIHPNQWLKGFSLGMAVMALAPLVWLLIKQTKGPWYLTVASIGFAALYFVKI